MVIICGIGLESLKSIELARKVQESERQYKTILQTTMDGFCLVDKQGKILQVNEAYCRMSGYSVQELLMMRISDVEVIEKPAETAARLQEIMTKGRVRFETKHRRKDGAAYDVEVNAQYQSLHEGWFFTFLHDITERKQTEAALMYHNILLSTQQEVSFDGILVVDENNRIVSSNSRFADMWGVPREIIESRDDRALLEFVTTRVTDPQSFFQKVQYLYENKKLTSQDELLLTDGRVFERYSAPMFESDGQYLGRVWYFHDITERKRAEEALRVSEEKFRKVFLSSADSININRLDDGKYVSINNGFTAVTGYTEADVIGRTSVELGIWVDLADRKRLVEGLKKHGEFRDLEARFRTKDGRIIVAKMSAAIIEIDHVKYLVNVTRDITERKRMEEDLREKEEKYRLLFESATDGIFILDETGFIDCNQKGAEMYGLTREKIVGRSPGDFAPERQPDGQLSSEVVGEKVRAALSGMPQIFEWQPLRAEGSPFDVEFTLNRLELNGKMCLQAIVRDIGDRKKLEQERLKAQKLEGIGTLAGGIAHDFNNLLQAVFGYISLAKLARDDREKSQEALEEAEKALHAAVKLTNQLLTFSKGGKPVKKTIDLLPVIQNATKFALSGSRTDFHVTVDDGLWMADADDGQISQVIQNIVLNADQAMPDGGRVEITARNVQIPGQDLPQVLEKGNYLQIAIQDTGVGISEKYIGRIFEPYFTTKEKGSGLGLATSYSIIKNHNGIIDVKSVVDKGTTFIIYLPAVAEGKREKQRKSVVAKLQQTGRILIMDDEPSILDVAGKLINALGHRVEFASQGKEAIEKYRDARQSGQPFDIVILDLTIRGGMGGAETLQKLSEIDPDVKAVVSSGYSSDMVIADYRAHGFKAYLKKPYNIENLQEILNMLLTL
jgi:PAS domain S-box-containing protein